MPARGPSRAFRLILFLAAGCWAFFCVVGFITTTWFQRAADERLALSSRSGRSSGRVASLLAPKLPPPPDWDVPPKWASDRFHGPSPESSYRLVSNATIGRHPTLGAYGGPGERERHMHSTRIPGYLRRKRESK